MAIPLLEYKPSSQNQRVRGFGVADLNEDTPYIYRWEDCSSSGDVEKLIYASYRQIFSEHEILNFNRQKNLESQLKNGSITLRDFVRGLAKSEAFYRLVVSVNNNYRLVNVCLQRFLGRTSYNKEEEIAWSIKMGTVGFSGFVDALLDSEEYTLAFGDFTVPYQQRRKQGRPFNLITPRYGEDFQAVAGTTTTDWRFTLEKFYSKQAKTRRLAEGDPRKFLDLAAAVNNKGNYAQSISSFSIDYLNKVPNRDRR